MEILVIDDHALIREALRGVLLEAVPGAAIFEAATWKQAEVALQAHPRCALALLDLKLPDRDGMDALAGLRARRPALAVIVLSAFNDRDRVVRALDLGAVGFIPKAADRAVILAALRLVLAGGIYIPPDILDRSATSGAAATSASPPGGFGRSRDLDLTPRQAEVLAEMMRGLSNKLICRKLGLAERTVKNNVTAILKALHATSRTQAVVRATELGWQPPSAD